jgi:PTS system fructose-specific IIC component
VRDHHPAGTLRRWLTTGVSYVIPLIATGGLLIALGYALGGQAVRDAPPVTAGFSWLQLASWAGLTFQLGTLVFTLIGPALGAAIGYAVAGRLALIPAAVGGLAAVYAGAGYLGGIAAGLLAGALVALAERVRRRPRCAPPGTSCCCRWPRP